MVRNLATNIDTIIEQGQFVLRDATIESIQVIKFDTSKEVYNLTGFLDSQPNLLEIVAIEGEDQNGNYVTEADLDETYYALEYSSDTVRTVPNGYGLASGKILYDDLKITFSVFRNESDIIVRYRWFNPNIIPVLTAFENGSVLNMLMRSIFNNMDQKLKLVDYDLEQFSLDTARDEGLKRLASFYSILETEGTSTTGHVLIENNSTTAYTVNLDTRFAVRSANGYILFKLTDIPGSYTVNPGSLYVPVICTQIGRVGNVGSYTINTIFEDNQLQIAPTDILVSNPPSIPITQGGVTTNQPNTFSDGIDSDNDETLRDKIRVRTNSSFGSTFDVILRAVKESPYVKEVLIHTFDTNKDVLANTLGISVVGYSKLSRETYTEIKRDIDNVISVGTDYTFRTVMDTIVDVEADVYVRSNVFGNTADLEEQISTNVKQHLNDTLIGQDLYSSNLISIISASTSVVNVVLKKLTVTEYVAEITKYEIPDTIDNSRFIMSSDNDDLEQVEDLYVGLIFNSIQKKEFGDFKDSLTYTTSESGIDSRIPPRATLGVIDYKGEMVIDPSNKRNYLTTYTTSGVTINPLLYTDVDTSYDLDVSSDIILVDYNYFRDLSLRGLRMSFEGHSIEELIEDNSDYDGLEITLSVVAGDDVSTATEVDGASATALINKNGINLYDFEFDQTVTFLATEIYWIKIKNNDTSTVVPFVTVPYGNTTDNNINRNPRVYYRAQGQDSDLNQVGVQFNFQTYISYEGSDAYETVAIPNNATIVETTRGGEVTLNVLEAIDI